MAYDFETLVPEIDAPSPMRTLLNSEGIPADRIDYGVAEMKFKLFPDIEKAIIETAKRNVLGYSAADDEYYSALTAWLKRRHGLDIKPEYVRQTYGIVVAIGICIRAFSEPGDNILIQTPVYHPFAINIKRNGRKVVESTLVLKDNRYEIDFADFEEKAKTAKMFILCSPHNPIGRVWTKDELAKMAEICLKHNVLIVADEIHNDIVYGAKHTIFPLAHKDIYDNCILCTAPSKTFNIPGLITSNIIIKNEALREKFTEERDRSIGHYTNPIGAAATTAALKNGDAWVDEMCEYIKGNYEYLESYLRGQIPQSNLIKMEATYLAWLDLRFLGLSDEEFKKFIFEDCKLYVNMGDMFGTGGSGFIRVNIGCPRRYVKEFVDIVKKAIEAR